MEYFGTNLTEYGHYRWLLTDVGMQKQWTKFDDLPFHPEELVRNLPKGEVAFYQGGGYTVIGISGSCKDDRPGTKSIFWVYEILDKQQMISIILSNKLAVEIINSMKFNVDWNYVID